MTHELPMPEVEIAAVLEAATLTANPTVNYLRAPNGPDVLPALVFSLADARFFDTVDGRFLGYDNTPYRVQIWSHDRQQLLEIFRDLLAWLLEWHPDDLINRLLVEVQSTPASGGADLAALATAVDTAITNATTATDLREQLAAVAQLKAAFPRGTAVPRPGENAAAAVQRLHALRAALPEILFGLQPTQAMDAPHPGFQDRGTYERNLTLLYTYSD